MYGKYGTYHYCLVPCRLLCKDSWALLTLLGTEYVRYTYPVSPPPVSEVTIIDNINTRKESALAPTKLTGCSQDRLSHTLSPKSQQINLSLLEVSRVKSRACLVVLQVSLIFYVVDYHAVEMTPVIIYRTK